MERSQTSLKVQYLNALKDASPTDRKHMIEFTIQLKGLKETDRTNELCCSNNFGTATHQTLSVHIF